MARQLNYVHPGGPKIQVPGWVKCIPEDLLSADPNLINLAKGHCFGVDEVERVHNGKHEWYKVVVITDQMLGGDAPHNNFKIAPPDLQAFKMHEFLPGIERSVFAIRQMRTKHASSAWVLIIEDFTVDYGFQFENRPRGSGFLYRNATDSYAANTQFFNWRWMDKECGRVKVVTLEQP